MKRLTALTMALCLLMVLPPLVPRVAAESTNAENRLVEQQKKMERLQRGVESQRARVKESSQKEENLLAEMDSLETKLRQERARLQGMQADLDRHEKLIAEKRAELENAKAAKEGNRLHMQKRLAAFYRLGQTDVLNVLFARESIPDLLNFDEYFRHLIQYDRKALSDYRAKITQITAAHDVLAREEKALVASIAEVKAEEQQLAETNTQRATLLRRVKTEKKLHQQALAEIEGAAQRLNITLEKLKQEAMARHKTAASRGGVASAAGGGAFAASKGRLDPPVSGTVTTRFGTNDSGKFGIATIQNGIDITTEPGAPIRAIYGGKVVYAGILRGYGTIIIIDHGDHYFSLMSRVGELRKKEGEVVSRGEVLATMSTQKEGLGEDLHFEIRHGTTPENPLHWVNNAKLKITATRR